MILVTFKNEQPIIHNDYVVISDYNKTNTSFFDGEALVETKDKVKVNLKYRVLFKWKIDFYLRYETGSFSENCNIQIWNKSIDSIDKYLEATKTDQEITFESYLEKKGYLKKLLFKKQLRKRWDRFVQKIFLLLDVDFVEDTAKPPTSKKTIQALGDYKLYNGSIKNQQILVLRNDGKKLIIDRIEFEKSHPLSNLTVISHLIS